ncbi:MAG: shikimate dehydrogenase [Pirellulales bacterium]|nr:shikimate dehydrogenase [Pirellulales bacterium]
MICVSIGRGRHRHMIAEHRHLAEQGAQLVELRLDYINGEPNVKRLVTDRPCPVVISCRRRRDGGKWSRGEEPRLLLLRTAIAEGVEYVDLEEDVAGQVPRFGKTRRIISMHDFRKTPDNLEEIHARLSKLDADVIKICTMANHPGDNLRMLKLVRTSSVPTVGICMGDIGIPSRILTGKFGAPFTYATFHQERVLAPGQLSYEQMTEIYRYDEINDQTEIFGVVADPIGHSLSPLIHNAAFGKLKMNRVYLPFRVPRENLSEFMDQAAELGVKGLSVTIPHKEAVLEKLTRLDEAVGGIGAANTVIFEGGGRHGYNTDSDAALASIEEAIAAEEQADPKDALERCSALVLGAGGVGKAIAYGLLRRGAQITVTDGDSERAKELAKRLSCRSVEWSLRHSVAADLLVNGTPVGMHPNVDQSPYDAHHLRSSMVVFDAVYNPENTLLIKEARARDCKVITGVDMFVRQACMQFNLFTGEDGPADLMRDMIKRATAAARM